MIAETLRQRRSGQRGAVRHHLRAGFMGFAGGALIIVPLALLSKGYVRVLPDLPQLPASIVAAPPPTPVARPAPVVSLELASEPLLIETPEPAAPPRIALSPQQAAEAVAENVDTARALIERGEILRARELLAADAATSSPEAAFLLAETYDPNVLAARNLAGVEADVAKAKRHYTSALIGEIGTARQRLLALEQ